MIDTLGIRVPREKILEAPVPARLFQSKEALRARKELKTLQASYLPDGSLSLSFSVPQLLYGSSMREYRNDDAAELYVGVLSVLRDLEVVVADICELPVYRLDLCRNIPTPRLATYYITHVARYEPARADVVQVAGYSTTIKWSRYQSLTFYDKEHKSGTRMRGRIVRIELQMKRASVIAGVVGVRVFADVFCLEELRVNAVLRRSVERVIGTVSVGVGTDPQSLWDQVGRNGERGKASLFVVYFLTTKEGLTPLEITTIREFLRERLSRKSYYQVIAKVLKRVSAAPMDEVFREDILNKLA